MLGEILIPTGMHTLKDGAGVGLTVGFLVGPGVG
jgi:hypothetical protein